MLSPKTVGGVKDGGAKRIASFGDLYGKGSIVGLGRSGRGRKRTFDEFEELEGRTGKVAETGAGEMDGIGDEAEDDDEDFDDPDDFYDECDWLSVAGEGEEEDLMGEHAVKVWEMV